MESAEAEFPLQASGGYLLSNDTWAQLEILAW